MITRLWLVLSLLWVVFYLWFCTSVENQYFWDVDIRGIVAPFLIGWLVKLMLRYIVFGTDGFRRRY